MSSPLLIVSTCGISVLTNTDEERPSKSTTYSNACNKEDVPPVDRQTIQALIDAAGARLANADEQVATRTSSEIGGLLAYLRQQGQPSHIHHLLIHTDTWVGTEAAELVRQWITARGLGTVEVLHQKDLQTRALNLFQGALADLTVALDERIEGYRQQHYRVVFNLTAGFKSINGYLQAIGMFYDAEVFYLFEKTNEPMIIPRLPVRLDAVNTIKEHLLPLRRLALGLLVDDPQQLAAIPETFLLRVDGVDGVVLSAWGELQWKQSYKALYEQQIFPPPSPRIRLGQKFNASIDKHATTPDRLRQINERLDDLARCLETGHNPNSLDFKALKGKPKPDITHEIDAWADGGAKRLYGYYQGDVFMVDHLGEHL
jgi:putative CRISPR-associated protein (TIGR02619 family)